MAPDLGTWLLETTHTISQLKSFCSHLAESQGLSGTYVGFSFKTRFYYKDQTGLEFSGLLPQPPMF